MNETNRRKAKRTTTEKVERQLDIHITRGINVKTEQAKGLIRRGKVSELLVVIVLDILPLPSMAICFTD